MNNVNFTMDKFCKGFPLGELSMIVAGWGTGKSFFRPIEELLKSRPKLPRKCYE